MWCRLALACIALSGCVSSSPVADGGEDLGAADLGAADVGPYDGGLPPGCYPDVPLCTHGDDGGACTEVTAWFATHFPYDHLPCTERCLACPTGRHIWVTAICNGTEWTVKDDVPCVSMPLDGGLPAHWLMGAAPDCPCP